MNFPRIEHIDDVLPHIEGRKEFKVMVRPEATTIDYVLQTPETFSHPILKECRGIKFCNETGEIIARPFQKFMNLGEKPDEEVGRDFSEAEVWEKRDGSLLHYITFNGEVRACTKAGITDVSTQAESELQLPESTLVRIGVMLGQGFTPCFEYTSPNNRIVVKYARPKITLLAVRDNVTGNYLDVNEASMYLNIDVTRAFKVFSLQDVRAWTELEGVVLAWPDGYRLKVKADDYVLRHRVKDDMSREHRLMEIILNDSIDDLVGVVDGEDYERILAYQKYVRGGLEVTTSRLNSMLESFAGMERKGVAKLVQKHTKPVQSVFWQCYGGKGVRESLEGFILKKSNKQVNLNSVRVLFDTDVQNVLEMESTNE